MRPCASVCARSAVDLVGRAAPGVSGMAQPVPALRKTANHELLVRAGDGSRLWSLCAWVGEMQPGSRPSGPPAPLRLLAILLLVRSHSSRGCMRLSTASMCSSGSLRLPSGGGIDQRVALLDVHPAHLELVLGAADKHRPCNVVHLVPCSLTASHSSWSSAPRRALAMPGARWLTQRSRHCFAVRPVTARRSGSSAALRGRQPRPRALPPRQPRASDARGRATACSSGPGALRR